MGGLADALNGRSKRTCDLTSSIVPRGTSFHRAVELACSPIGFDLALSCFCSLLPAPAELGAVNPEMRCMITASRRASATIAFFMRGAGPAASPGACPTRTTARRSSVAADLHCPIPAATGRDRRGNSLASAEHHVRAVGGDCIHIGLAHASVSHPIATFSAMAPAGPRRCMKPA